MRAYETLAAQGKRLPLVDAHYGIVHAGPAYSLGVEFAIAFLPCARRDEGHTKGRDQSPAIWHPTFWLGPRPETMVGRVLVFPSYC